MTRKRRYLISAAVLATCVCIALGVLAMLPGSRITNANCDRIQDYMSEAEVEAILGEPSFDSHSKVADGTMHLVHWCEDNDTEIRVMFVEGKAIEVRRRGLDETIPGKLRRWLHLPK